MSTAYVLKIAEPEARRAGISLEADTRGAASMEARLPVWTPGSYLVREHQRHVDGLRAVDQDGRPLPVEKVDKHTWRVASAGARRVRVEYRLGCFELTVRTNHVDPTHAFLNPAAACAFFAGREGEPCTVRTEAPAEWRTWVALPQRGGAFHAEDYDELADSPFEMGPLTSHAVHSFAVQGVPHELVLWGRGDFEARRAGLITPQRFLEIWGERLTTLQRTPGRLRTPLAQASYDSWIKHYRPDESTANTTVSYYLKGSVVGFLLDLELRRRSGGKRSLDDLVRLLFERHGRPPGLPEDGVEKAALDLVPGLEGWFDRALRSAEELDVDAALGGVGLRPVVRPASGPEDKGGAEQSAK